MVSKKLLDATGCTSDRLREIFTQKDTSHADYKIRKTFEERFTSRIQDGMAVCLQHANIWQAVDIAWDSTPIHKQTVPLLLFAQGKVKFEDIQKQVSQDTLKQFCRKDKEGNFKVDMPRLHEISINLVRSYVTRRLAAQTARFSNLWPYFKYEPFGTDEVAKLRGDVLSQRVDVMVNAYNYRHLFPQSYRHMFLYGRALMFPRSAWDTKLAWRLKEENSTPGAEPVLDGFVEREGIDFTLAHPSRYYWDRSAPLPNINTDTGPSWVGYWDIVLFSALQGGDFYNLDSVSTSDAQSGMITTNGAYFNYYFDPKVLTFPSISHPATINDRRAGIGIYSATDGDKGVIITQHFERINPKQAGIAKLNADVWVRFSVAGDGTVVAAEFMPSIPAIYGGINENDDRTINNSMAMELMPFQDQLSNIFSQMLMNLKNSFAQIWAIDKDVLSPEMQKYIKDTLESGEYYTQPQAWFYSGSKVREAGFQNPGDNPRAFLNIIQANIQTTINQSMQAVGEVLNMADRVLVLSNNEAGQSNPREVSAREITEISGTTNTIVTFVSDGIDEQRAAAKKLIYESLVGMSTQNFRVPAMSRYLAKTLRKAGFNTPDGLSEDENAILPIKTTIVGRVSDLQYDYYFDSRDGADRPVNSQGAAVLSQLMGQILQVQPLAEAVGKKRIFEILNEIFRLSGAAYDLNLDVEDGENEGIPSEGGSTGGNTGDLSQRVAAMEQFLTSLKDQLQQSGVAPISGGPSPAPVAPGSPPAALMPA